LLSVLTSIVVSLSIYHYRNPRLCLEFVSVLRAKQKALGKEGFAEREIKNSRHRKILGTEASLPRAK
jgi:hypothetical protein